MKHRARMQAQMEADKAAQAAKNIQENYRADLTNSNRPTIGAALAATDAADPNAGSVPGVADDDPRRRRKGGLSSQLGINA